MLTDIEKNKIKEEEIYRSKLQEEMVFDAAVEEELDEWLAAMRKRDNNRPVYSQAIGSFKELSDTKIDRIKALRRAEIKNKIEAQGGLAAYAKSKKVYADSSRKLAYIALLWWGFWIVVPVWLFIKVFFLSN